MGLCLGVVFPVVPEGMGVDGRDDFGLMHVPLVELGFGLAGTGMGLGLAEEGLEQDADFGLEAVDFTLVSIGIGLDKGFTEIGIVIDFVTHPTPGLELLVMTMDLLGLAIMVMPLGPVLIMIPLGLPDTPPMGGVALALGPSETTIGLGVLSKSMISTSGDLPAEGGRSTLVGVVIDGFMGDALAVILAPGEGFGGMISTTLTGTMAL